MRTVVVGDLKQQLSKKAPCRPYYIENETLSTLQEICLHIKILLTIRTVAVSDLKQQLSKKAPCHPYCIENETLSTLFAYTLRDLSTL